MYAQADIERIRGTIFGSSILLERWFLEGVLLQPQIAGALRSLLGSNVGLPVISPHHGGAQPIQPAQRWVGGAMQATVTLSLRRHLALLCRAAQPFPRDDLHAYTCIRDPMYVSVCTAPRCRLRVWSSTQLPGVVLLPARHTNRVRADSCHARHASGTIRSARQRCGERDRLRVPGGNAGAAPPEHTAPSARDHAVDVSAHAQVQLLALTI
jgi:hypothetical protein